MVHVPFTPVDKSALLRNRTGPGWFPVAFSATPSPFEGQLSVSFIPTLPATATQHPLSQTPCDVGRLNDLLDALATERGVTLHARFPMLPAEVQPKKNTQWDAATFAYDWLTWIAETPTRVRMIAEPPYGGPRNEGDVTACFQVWP